MILGVDPGERRYGVALAHEETGLATPVAVLDASTENPVEGVLRIAAEHSARLIVVGRPVGLSGRAGPAVAVQSEFVAKLRSATSIPVEEHDERLTTVIAAQGIKAAGGKSSKLIDAVAAQVMLQGYLDTRSSLKGGDDRS